MPKATLILTNPPFGTKKGGGLPSRDDFTFPTSNKQFCFLQHIYRALLPNGRAAVVMPDNVLFEGNVGKHIRTDLMDKCNLHTILRLPTGIFYAQGVKTNVLFFTRGETDKGNTKEVWVYDLRANAPAFGKRTQLTHAYFTEFEKAFGNDPLGSPASLKKRKDTSEQGRFRRFTREWIAERGDSLDISWLKDESTDGADELPEPAMLAQEAMGELEAAMEPDVIMIGEIRDLETAEIAVQSALTGHLVLSTVHTNDAPSTVNRLLDMGVEDYLLTSTVVGILAQRLVRALCPHCRKPYRALPEVVSQMGLGRFAAPGEVTLYHPAGCEHCSGTGYHGRLGIMEMMPMTDRVRSLVMRHANSTDLRAAAVDERMESMFENGLRKAVAGVTTVEEVLRVTRED